VTGRQKPLTTTQVPLNGSAYSADLSSDTYSSFYPDKGQSEGVSNFKPTSECNSSLGRQGGSAGANGASRDSGTDSHLNNGAYQVSGEKEAAEPRRSTVRRSQMLVLDASEQTSASSISASSSAEPNDRISEWERRVEVVDWGQHFSLFVKHRVGAASWS